MEKLCLCLERDFSFKKELEKEWELTIITLLKLKITIDQ